MQESSDFLTRINIVPVSEMKGKKLVSVSPAPSPAPPTLPGHRASAEGLLEAGVKQVRMRQINFDFYIRYKTLDLWARYQISSSVSVTPLSNVSPLISSCRF